MGEVAKNESNGIMDEVFAVLIGILLFQFSIFLLWFIERQAVKFMLLIGRCYKSTRVVPDSKSIRRRFEQRSVLVQGKTKVQGEYSIANIDPTTGFVFFEQGKNVIRLDRRVEMYQWAEKKSKDDNYTYELQWRCDDVNSYQFKYSNGHHNPQRNPDIYSKTTNAKSVFLGAFSLRDVQIQSLDAFRPCALTGRDRVIEDEAKSSNVFIDSTVVVKNQTGGHIEKGFSHGDTEYLLFNGTLSNPVPGTIRISYSAVYEDGPVTVVAVQDGTSFRPFTEADAHRNVTPCCAQLSDASAVCCSGGGSSDEIPSEGGESCGCCCVCSASVYVAQMFASGTIGNDVMLLEERHADLQTMFAVAKSRFQSRLWLMRLLGSVLLFLGLWLCFSPAATLLSWIPFIGKFAVNLLWFVCAVLSLVLSTAVISLAWVAYHPEMLGLSLLSLGAYFVAFGSTHAVTTTGSVLCVSAVAPLVVFAWNKVDDCRFAAAERDLDKRNEELFPSPTLLGRRNDRNSEDDDRSSLLGKKKGSSYYESIV